MFIRFRHEHPARMFPEQARRIGSISSVDIPQKVILAIA